MHMPRGRSPAILLIALIALLVISACGDTAAPSTGQVEYGLEREAGSAAAPTISGFAPVMEEPEPAAGAEAPADQEAAAGPLGATPIAQTVGFATDPNRKIIKNADLTIEVESVEIGLSRISAIAAQTGGYLLDSRTDFAESTAKSAVIQIAVPVERFEVALGRIREVGAVLGEQASGTDVTQEFVDVQSQIANLEATQARVREFLSQATTVEEALQVNAQLTEIEGQISQLKGRLQFLSGRAAYSTITIRLQQAPPEITPTPSPTPSPTPEPVAWDPSEPANKALNALTVVLQALATVGIWLAVFVLPLALPVLIVALIVRSRRNRSAPRPLADDPASRQTGNV